MSIVKPFKGVRPSRDKVALVSSKSYEAYSNEELSAKLAFNPFSFLHVVNPGYKYHQEDISGEKRFKLVYNRYLEFKEEEIFTQDSAPSYYVYQKRKPNGQSYCGIIAAVAASDFHDGNIRIHERTLASREVMFENYLKNACSRACLRSFNETERAQGGQIHACRLWVQISSRNVQTTISE